MSRVTLRKAIDQLCLDGWLVRQQGARTVVAPRLEKMVSKLTGFSDEMRSRGREPGTAWVCKALTKPTPTEAEQRLIVPGLRAGHYLCFFGMHVLTPSVMAMLAEEVAAALKMPLLQWHIKSTTKAQQGLYEYDAVSRLRDSQLGDERVKDIHNYIVRGVLWQAFTSDEPVVLLIDERC